MSTRTLADRLETSTLRLVARTSLVAVAASVVGCVVAPPGSGDPTGGMPPSASPAPGAIWPAPAPAPPQRPSDSPRSGSSGRGVPDLRPTGVKAATSGGGASSGTSSGSAAQSAAGGGTGGTALPARPPGQTAERPATPGSTPGPANGGAASTPRPGPGPSTGGGSINSADCVLKPADCAGVKYPAAIPAPGSPPTKPGDRDMRLHIDLNATKPLTKKALAGQPAAPVEQMKVPITQPKVATDKAAVKAGVAAQSATSTVQARKAGVAGAKAAVAVPGALAPKTMPGN